MNHIWHGQWGKKAVDPSTAKRPFLALFSCVSSLFSSLTFPFVQLLNSLISAGLPTISVVTPEYTLCHLLKRNLPTRTRKWQRKCLPLDSPHRCSLLLLHPLLIGQNVSTQSYWQRKLHISSRVHI
jgi:hypothetical protein